MNKGKITWAVGLESLNRCPTAPQKPQEKRTKLLARANFDSGLEVDALGGAPGIYSARYAASDKQRIERLLEELKGSIYRSAGFHSAVALADPFGNIHLEAEGICRGEILSSPRGEGYGYDPVFWLREAGSTYG
ncbi:MAG: non-canonical purine NTP pyrophosphatase, partial [Synechococcaceae bacterium WBA_3_309]|nr:non-canonical purine NTP pyrophosphatase [Synechococcaceae bacterium WBA_3_309]